jgi:hypothetical protein
MNKWVELILGLVLLIAAILVGFFSQNWVVFGKDLNFLHSALIFLKGGVFWFVIMISLLLIILGINDLKE